MVAAGGDGGHTEYAHPIHENFAHLGDLAVHGKHAGGRRVTPPAGKVEHERR